MQKRFHFSIFISLLNDYLIDSQFMFFCFCSNPAAPPSSFSIVVVVLWFAEPHEYLVCIDCDWGWPLTSLARWNSIHDASATRWPPAALRFYWLKDSLCLWSKEPPVRINRSEVETLGNEAMKYGLPLTAEATILSFCTHSGTHEKQSTCDCDR